MRALYVGQKMKTIILLLLQVVLAASCAVPEPGNFVDAAEVRKVHKPIPNLIIKQLPSRLEELPKDRQLNLIEFLDLTGLRSYSGNIELDRNGYCMFLDEKRTLVISSRGHAISRRDVERHLAADPSLMLPNVLGGDDARVSGCILMSEDNSVLYNYSFAESAPKQ